MGKQNAERTSATARERLAGTGSTACRRSRRCWRARRTGRTSRTRR